MKTLKSITDQAPSTMATTDNQPEVNDLSTHQLGSGGIDWNGTDFGKKKKRTRNKHREKEIEANLEKVDVEEEGDERLTDYDQLLKRAFVEINKTRDNTEDTKKVIHVQAPLLLRQSLRVALTNFVDICKQLRRPYRHVMQYISIECGSSCCITSKNHLLIRGRFRPKHIQNLLKHYIRDYVLCKACGSADTFFERDGRLTFLSCHQCRASRTVPPLKEGYKAKVRY